jgi:hypothetical protein
MSEDTVVVEKRPSKYFDDLMGSHGLRPGEDVSRGRLRNLLASSPKQESDVTASILEEFQKLYELKSRGRNKSGSLVFSFPSEVKDKGLKTVLSSLNLSSETKPRLFVEDDASTVRLVNGQVAVRFNLEDIEEPTFREERHKNGQWNAGEEKPVEREGVLKLLQFAEKETRSNTSNRSGSS